MFKVKNLNPLKKSLLTKEVMFCFSADSRICWMCCRTEVHQYPIDPETCFPFISHTDTHSLCVVASFLCEILYLPLKSPRLCLLNSLAVLLRSQSAVGLSTDLWVVGVAWLRAPPHLLGSHPVALHCGVMFTDIKENWKLAVK